MNKLDKPVSGLLIITFKILSNSAMKISEAEKVHVANVEGYTLLMKSIVKIKYVVKKHAEVSWTKEEKNVKPRSEEKNVKKETFM